MDEQIKDWLTTQEAAQITDMTLQGISAAIRSGRLIGKKIGSKRRGIWLVEPESVRLFVKHSKRTLA